MPKVDAKVSSFGMNKTVNAEHIDAVKQDTQREAPTDVKCVSWNVGGLASAIKKEFFLKYLEAEDAELVCLQEVRMDKEKLALARKKDLTQLESLYPYSYWHCSSQQKGYSGTAILSKLPALKVIYGLPEDKDKEGRVIACVFEHAILVNAYVPNAGQNLVRIDWKIDWNKSFFDYLVHLKETYNKPIILTGDINVCATSIDLARPQANWNKTAGWTAKETEQFRQLLQLGFTDTLRVFQPNVPDLYTYWGFRFGAREKNLGWRLDYFLTPPSFQTHIRSCIIRRHIYGISDHVPIVLTVDYL